MFVKYCFLRHSPSLRAAIKFRMEQKGVTAADVARAVGISPINHVYYYLTVSIPTKLTQHKVLRICTYLGIKIGINIEYEHS